MKNFNFNYIKVLDYFKGDDLAASTWINKYALKNEEGEIIEETPDDMHKRLAREFYKVEKTYQERDYVKTEALSNYGQNRPMLSEDAIYELFKNFKYIIPGGSVMSGLGSSNPISLSNCFVIDGPNDSYQDIMRARTEQIQLMKRRGGVGYDLSKLRPRGAKVHNAAVTSTGAASFMDVCSDITNEVAQEGRRGALMLTISINHPDVEEFITKKQDLTKVTGANISVQVTDEFMKAVEKEEDFILRYPVSSKLTSNLNKEEVCKAPYNELCVTLDSFGNEVGYYKKVKAKELWNKLIHCAWNTAEPGIIFSDAMRMKSPDFEYPKYRMVCCNPCAEIGMGAYDSCRLLHINLTSFVDRPFTETATVNYKKLYEITYEAQRLADDLVTLEIKAVDRIISHLDKLKDKDEIELWNKFRNTALGGRRTGVGFTGLMDMLAMVSTNTEIRTADPSMEFVLRQISYGMMQAELDCTIDMAITRGVFLDYDNPAKYTLHLSNWNKFVSKEFPGTFDRMCKYGRRNISFSTIAPTGTVSIMARCSSGIEPIFRAVYKRKRKCMSPSEQADFVDKNGERFITFVVVHPGLRQWAETIYPKEVLDKLTAEKWEQLCKDSPYNYFTADSMSIGERLDIQSILQKYITHSISSTINVSKEFSEDSIGIIYFTAWERGCKGITIYRDGSREGILTSIKEAKPDNILCCNAPKRPKELVADYYQIKVKGEQFIVLVGLYKDKPYEIFCLKTLRPVNVPFHQGIITKLSKMHYHFKSKYYEIANLEDVNANMEEKATTLYASMLLRHGVAIKYIIKTAKKVDDNIASFTAAICRVLSKYVEKEELKEKCPKCGAALIREEGCIHCSNCDYSKCG